MKRDEFEVLPTAAWEADLERIKTFMIQRELEGHSIDESLLDRFEAALARALEILTFAPCPCRRAEVRPDLRELVIPFEHSGCVALFATEPGRFVMLAVRHQH